MLGGFLVSIKRDPRIDGEYNRPLPERIETPTKEDLEKLQRLLEKYTKRAEKRSANDESKI
jgi:hypothetical protein